MQVNTEPAAKGPFVVHRLPMKKNILIPALLVLQLAVSGQTVPLLSENSLIQKNERGTKAGWTKVLLDARFKETKDDSLAFYFYYEFVNTTGHYNSTRSPKTGFPADAARIVYENKKLFPSSKTLNGSVDFYNKKGYRISRYIFKDGFLIYEFDFIWGIFQKKYTGKLKTALEYIPSEYQVEMRCNSFDSRGACTQYAHDMNDGKTYTPIPGIPNISLEALNIGTVWKAIEFDAYKYDMFIDTVSHNGTNAASIKSIAKKINGSGGLVQLIKADQYLGKRIRFTAWMKTQNVSGWAGLWLRIDQGSSSFAICSDNMRDRPVRGTNDWIKYEIVVDVPASAGTISFGAMLHGSGQIWFDDMAFETVDNSVKTTGISNPGSSAGLGSEPLNMNFEK